jgi:hypothetical protein
MACPTCAGSLLELMNLVDQLDDVQDTRLELGNGSAIAVLQLGRSAIAVAVLPPTASFEHGMPQLGRQFAGTPDISRCNLQDPRKFFLCRLVESETVQNVGGGNRLLLGGKFAVRQGGTLLADSYCVWSMNKHMRNIFSRST